MKNFLVLFFLICSPIVCCAQILGDGWTREEHDAYWQEIQQRDRERERAHQRFLEEQERERIRQEKALEKALEDALNRARAQKQREQQKADRNRQIAERNKQVAERNRQIEEENQRIAEENRRRQIEAERRRKEEELRRREETRKRVTAETYQRLETQTRNMQNAAAYASGEGAYRLQQEHNVARYEQQIQPGMGNAVSQISHLPKQKFTLPKNDFVLDPNRIYHLDTWNLSSSEDIGYTFSVPSTPFIRKITPEWNNFYNAIPSRRTSTYMTMMINMCDGEMPEIYEKKDAFAFLSPDGNTVFRVSKDGKSFLVVDLDDPENVEYKNDLYAKVNSGVKGLGKIEMKTDGKVKFKNENGTTMTPIDHGVSIQGKIDSKSVDPFANEEKVDLNMEKEEKDIANIGVSAGREMGLDNTSKLKCTYLYFVSKNQAVLVRGTIEGGGKATVDASVNLSSDMQKTGLGLNAGVEGVAVKGDVGYIYTTENGFYLAEAGLRGGAGYSVGANVAMNHGKFGAGIFSLAYDVNLQYVTYRE